MAERKFLQARGWGWSRVCFVKLSAILSRTRFFLRKFGAIAGITNEIILRCVQWQCRK